jgi:hypothetical protein
MEHGLMEDKINKYNNNPDYDAGYQEGWENAINYALDILNHMQYNDNNKWHNETLEELGQRIV